MAEILNISKLKPTFLDRVGGENLNDLKKTSNDVIKVAERAFKTKRTITSESSSMGVDHVFSIPNNHQYVSHFYLEIQPTNSVVYKFDDWAIAANLIKTIKVEINSEPMCTYTGPDLVKLIRLANRSSQTAFDELSSIAGSGDVNANVLLIPILVPGSNLVHSLDAFDVRAPAFPLGACNSPMVITITLQNSTYASDLGVVINAPKLNFYAYSVDEVKNLSNKQVSNDGLYYSWMYVKPITGSQTRTLTANVEDQFVIDNIILEGELEYVLIDFLNSTQSADYKYVTSSEMSKLSLKIMGTENLYEHTNVWEGRLNFLRDFKCTNKVKSSSGYFYGMTTTMRPDLGGISGNLGTKGINLNLNKPTVYVTDTAGETYLIRYVACYKAMYNIYNNKNFKAIIYPQ